MMKYLSIAVLALGLQGCSWLSSGLITVKKEEVARTPLDLPDPAPVKANSPRWIVVTPENVERVWKQLKDNKTDLVLFALTDDGYEELSINLAEIRNFIELQRRITEEYRKYYEPKKP